MQLLHGGKIVLGRHFNGDFAQCNDGVAHLFAQHFANALSQFVGVYSVGSHGSYICMMP